jgi:hypothetical protein
MKPFNLTEALAGKPVVTRRGRNVSEIRHLPTGKQYQVAAVVDGDLNTYTTTGQYIAKGSAHDDDLFMGSTMREGWAYIYGDATEMRILSRLYQTEAEARAACVGWLAPITLIATVRIEWEE